MVLTSALEFFIGFIMEQFFHDKWWDYSENPFNIKGYICLEFSLVWGAACVLVVDVIHPMIFKLICAIPEKLSLWLMVFFTAVLISDAVITLWNMLKLPKRLRAKKAELEAKLEALRKPNIISERIAMAYPKLSEGRHYGRQIAKIRERRAQRKNGGKQ